MGQAKFDEFDEEVVSTYLRKLKMKCWAFFY